MEINIEKGRQEQWQQILESDTSASATAAVTTHVFMDLEEDGKPIGRVTLGLFGDAAPRTAENFRALTTGEKVLKIREEDTAVCCPASVLMARRSADVLQSLVWKPPFGEGAEAQINVKCMTRCVAHRACIAGCAGLLRGWNAAALQGQHLPPHHPWVHDPSRRLHTWCAYVLLRTACVAWWCVC